MAWFLEYSTSDGDKVTLTIEPGTLRIGRGSNSDTRIEDAAMSRLHCAVTLENDSVTLQDLGSSSGTYFGRKKIAETISIGSGQHFQAGNTKFKLYSDSPLDAPTEVLGMASRHTELKALVEKIQKEGKLDRFQIKKTINTTGNNLVFRAEDTKDGDSVALKVIPTEEGTEEDEARFMRAMGILQEVRDPYLVQLYRAGRRKKFCWVAMDWLPEGSLADRINKVGIRNCLEWKELWQVAHSISQSLHVLERNGIVHRNIKPTNILVRQATKSYLLSDLVVAKAMDSSKEKRLVTRQVFLPSDLAYTSPERLLGADVSEHTLQADIYSLGAVLTELLTGSAPYGHGGLKEVLPRLGQPRHLASVKSQIGVNELFVDLINTMTEPEPGKRFGTAFKLWQEVERVGKLSGLSCL